MDPKVAPKIAAKIVVVIPSWNHKDGLGSCIDSVLAGSVVPHLIVVDNGSSDGSADFVAEKYPQVELIRHTVNKGYAGGVNPGFRRAIELGASYVAPFNNDAIADKDWLKNLADYLDAHGDIGIAACKVLSSDGSHLDTTGDLYTNWGLPYPRGRGEADNGQYDSSTDVFGASGAASLYRVSMLAEIGVLDEDFFAYYEDVDLSFRAQLAGYKVAYVPGSRVYHEMNVTGNRIKGLFTYQTIKNYTWIFYKDVPASLMLGIGIRLWLAQILFIGRAITRGNGWYAIKGVAVSHALLPRKLAERRRIQSKRKVSPSYIWSIITHDLPPNAANLRRIRGAWWKLVGKRNESGKSREA
jgi:GT2 family glycosyltransferase